MTLTSPSLLSSDASSVVTSSSSSSSISSSSTSTTGNTTNLGLARVTSAGSLADVQQYAHPLSPELPSSNKRTSYFRPSPSLLATEESVIFADSEEQPEPETVHTLFNEHDVNTPKILEASPKLRGETYNATIRLPKAPHLISHSELKRRIQEQDVNGNGIDVAFVQELSKQLSETQLELNRQRKRQDAREAALLQLLRESAVGQVTEGMINRALVRASAEASEQDTAEAQDGIPYKIIVKLPQTRTTRGKNGSATGRLPLNEDLQDAMSEADFAEHAFSILSTAPKARRNLSPKARGPSTSSSPVSVSNASLQERRGRQPSTSISTRLFGSFSPSSSSHLSPTVPVGLPTATEESPSQVAVQKKTRANSIRSVQSTSSVASTSQKGITGWAGSLWSWKQGSSKHRYHSESEDEDEVLATGDRHRRGSTPSQVHIENSSLRSSVPTDTDVASTSTRPRAASKSSSNSTSTMSVDTTAATSFMSYGPVMTGQASAAISPPAATSSDSHLDSIQIPKGKAKPSGTSPNREGPVRTLLGRRTSGLHPEAALITDVVPTPISATAPTSATSKRDISLSTSTAMLQSISTSHDKHARLDVPEPTHFKAVSESASTIGKNGGEVVAEEVYKTPNRVSENVNQWTQRLLASFSPPNLSPIAATNPASMLQSESMDSPSPASRRSRSPRLKAGKGKAALSLPAVHSDAIPTTIRLSTASPTDEMSQGIPSTEEPASDEAMPLASKTNIKQKGYLASAKGTLGRAFGYSSHSQSQTKGTRRNSLKGNLEPALTLPTAFTSFTASASSSILSTPATATHPPSSALHAPKTSSGALEMGTIVAPEAKPPSLSNDLADQMKNGPLIDRFGFVYDIKAGMKLLKENRKKQQDKDEIMSLDSPPAAEVNVDELKEALGPSPCPTPALDTALHNAALPLALSSLPIVEEEGGVRSPTLPAEAQQKAPAMSEQPSNQSIRRLLSQLGEMNENVEKAQKDSWDTFIKRRKAKASRPKTEEEQAAAKKKRMTATEAPLSTGKLTDEDTEVDQFTENLVGVASMGTGKQDDKVFRQLVKSGIPIVYRPAIWAEVSGASEIREPGLYQELLAKHAGETSSCLEQIDMDTHRTFPTNVFFAGNGPGVLKLRRVLIAYSWRDPAIGYCQGMNLLAALLLLVYPDEEDAFWMLSSVLERILPSDYYSSQLLVSQADQRVLQDLIELALPDLYAHLEDLGVDLPAITFGWFLSLFTDALPIQTLLRVWDVLLVYGPISLFKIAIAIFKIHSAEIFATDSASNFYVLLTSMTSHMYSADKLLKTAFDDLRFIKRQDIESRRLKHVADIERELAPLPSAQD